MVGYGLQTGRGPATRFVELYIQPAGRGCRQIRNGLIFRRRRVGFSSYQAPATAVAKNNQLILVNRRRRRYRTICRGRQGGSGSVASETAMGIDCDRDMQYIQAHV